MRIEGFENFNTAEAIIGNCLLEGTRLIVPFYNVKIMKNDDLLARSFSGNYVELCHVIFKGVLSFTFNYESSRLYPKDVYRMCIGGTHFLSGEDVEFWVFYNNVTLVFSEECNLSEDPWRNDHSQIVNKFAQFASQPLPK